MEKRIINGKVVLLNLSFVLERCSQKEKTLIERKREERKRGRSTVKGTVVPILGNRELP
jgi:hypothetical protein